MSLRTTSRRRTTAVDRRMRCKCRTSASTGSCSGSRTRRLSSITCESHSGGVGARAGAEANSTVGRGRPSLSRRHWRSLRKSCFRSEGVRECRSRALAVDGAPPITTAAWPGGAWAITDPVRQRRSRAVTGKCRYPTLGLPRLRSVSPERTHTDRWPGWCAGLGDDEREHGRPAQRS